MSPSQGDKHILVMICIFSHWVEAFPYRKATALKVDRMLLEKINPNWGIPSELHSDQGTNFTGQIRQSICNTRPIPQHFHCAYHHESSGLVEHTNSTIKIQLAKVSETFTLLWPKALPIVLLNLKPTPFGKCSLSPYRKTKWNSHWSPYAFGWRGMWTNLTKRRHSILLSRAC